MPANIPSKKSHYRPLHTLGWLTCALLCACGGSKDAGRPYGTISLALTDGPAANVSHVWVTVKSIALHADADASWGAGIGGWVVLPLRQPQTIDLTTLGNAGDTGSTGVDNNGLSQLLSRQALPAGTYRQMRIFLAGARDLPKLSTALAVHDTRGATLAYNDQVETIVGNTIAEYPLDMPYPSQGITLKGSFAITTGQDLSVAVDFNLETGLVATAGSGYTLSPTLDYVDLSQAGAITGNIDPSALCPVGFANQPANTSNCAYNVVARADLEGGLHSTAINPLTGHFTLFPVATKDSGGNPVRYNVLIRGRQMDTMLITGVPVQPVATSAGAGLANATVLQGGAITPTINTSEYQAQFAAALTALSSATSVFYEGLSLVSNYFGAQVGLASTDPYTGLLAQPQWLENGPVQVAGYSNGGSLAFSTVTPDHGIGGYSVNTSISPLLPVANSPIVCTDLVIAPSVVTPPTSTGTLATFNQFGPWLNCGVTGGSITFNLSLDNPGTLDTAFIALSRAGSVVTTHNISTGLGGNSAVSLTGIPSGSPMVQVPGAEYFAEVVVWNSAQPVLSRRILPIAQRINMRSANSISVTAALDASNPAAGI